MFASALFFIAIASAQVAVPPLKARVTDLTATLNALQRDALERTLAEFEARKGAQIAVLMVPTTQPETIEQYAVRVQEAWKLGRKGVDDGALLVVAKNDRKVKIEVGYGLEGILPDAIAKRIIEDDILPRFREGDFYGGIRAGVDRIMRVVEGEKLPPPAAAPSAYGRLHAVGFNPEWILPIFVFVALGGGILSAIFGRLAGSGAMGLLAGFMIWAAVGSFMVALVIGFVVFVVLIVFSGRHWGSGWSSGGFGGGSWGGGCGGGGGGFSGGGGSSGGGGASGSW
jgi:uncharacterized protein